MTAPPRLVPERGLWRPAEIDSSKVKRPNLTIVTIPQVGADGALMGATLEVLGCGGGYCSGLSPQLLIGTCLNGAIAFKGKYYFDTANGVYNQDSLELSLVVGRGGRAATEVLNKVAKVFYK